MIKNPLPKALFAKACSITEPSCFTKASKVVVWKHVMNIEFNALISNATWNFVPHHSSYNLISNKWVYQIKYCAIDNIKRYKARLVAKSYHQQQGIDFTDTFSLVIKPSKIRLVLSLAVTNWWPI